MTVTDDVQMVDFARLKLDLENPRFVGQPLESEDEMIAYLYENADLSELLMSILDSGYLDFEPLVIRAGDGVVLEGNRRVAALRLIRDGELRERLKIKLDATPHEGALPKEVRALLVQDRRDARRYIGFKHINGPQKWDAMSKAKYASDWHAEGASIAEISRALGDTFNTVSRLVAGFAAYKQAEGLGFDPEKRSAKRFAFSHLYTALTRSSVKDWLDLDNGTSQRPVPATKEERLLQLMSWLYGQGDGEPAVVRTQNPDLSRLSDVIGNSRTREMLVATRNLDVAYEELEPRSSRLESALIQAVKHSESASAVSASFDGRVSTYELAQRLFSTARGLVRAFKAKQDQLEGLDEEP